VPATQSALAIYILRLRTKPKDLLEDWHQTQLSYNIFNMAKTDLPTTISIKEIKKIHDLSAQLSEFTEDLLESQGAYSDEFIQGLERSLEEARAGKTKRIKSLSDLL